MMLMRTDPFRGLDGIRRTHGPDRPAQQPVGPGTWSRDEARMTLSERPLGVFSRKIAVRTGTATGMGRKQISG
ncbi:MULTISPECIES: hypothetical protein [unclassified Streptomyces]|uniref:hypothetical protein n=1 Tax=unclassified Streptomyces TaxID=2593676 RepID=UPI0033E74CA0